MTSVYTRNLYGEPIRAPERRMPPGRNFPVPDVGESSTASIRAAGWCPDCHQRREECECQELAREELDFG